MPKANVLVIDGDKAIVQSVKTALQSAGHNVTSTSGKTALEDAHQARPDLILLDLTAYKGNGNEVLTGLRADGEFHTNVPIIVFVGRDREEEAAVAVEGGADDFIVKPFKASEVAARVQIALRKGPREEAARSVALRAGPVFMHVARREVLFREESGEMRPIELTKREFNLLRALMARKNQMMTRKQLVLEAFGEHAQVEPGNLGAYIHRLREKVEPNPGIPRYIVTDRGMGFKMID